MPKLSSAVMALALLAGPTLAQGTAIPPGQSVGTAPTTPPQAQSGTKAAPTSKVERTAKSKDCSAQADQQGLHGKARNKFRSACKAGKV